MTSTYDELVVGVTAPGRPDPRRARRGGRRTQVRRRWLATPGRPAPVRPPTVEPRHPVAHPWTRAVLLAVLLSTAIFLVVRPTPSIDVSAWNALATRIAATAVQGTPTDRVTGGYVPGQGLVFAADLSGLARADLNAWLIALLAPVRTTLADLARDEAVIWQFRVTGTTSGDYGLLVSVPRRAATNPRLWTSTITSVPAAQGAVTASPAAASPVTASPAAASPAAVTTP